MVIITYSLDGEDLGIIQSERARKESGILPLRLPFSDSSEVEGIDFEGALKVININAIKTGTVAQHSAFITILDNWINGQQDTAISFVSDLNGTKNVKVLDGDWNWNAGKPNILEYSLRLMESV